MRCGVLGQLSVWTAEGMPVRVPELRVRTLLASLPVDAGRPVSAHRLIADLWGEEQPGNPLRADKAQPGARELVATRAHVPAAPREALDSAAFTALAARARSSERITGRTPADAEAGA